MVIVGAIVPPTVGPGGFEHIRHSMQTQFPLNEATATEEKQQIQQMPCMMCERNAQHSVTSRTRKSGNLFFTIMYLECKQSWELSCPPQ